MVKSCTGRELAWMSPHDLLISRWNNDGGLFFVLFFFNLDLRGDLLINQLIFYAVHTSKAKQKLVTFRAFKARKYDKVTNIKVETM